MGECELPYTAATSSHFHRETKSRLASQSIAHDRRIRIAPERRDGKFQFGFFGCTALVRIGMQRFVKVYGLPGAWCGKASAKPWYRKRGKSLAPDD
jgi:hypothetical protein